MFCKYFILSITFMVTLYECDSQLKVFSPKSIKDAVSLARYGFTITNLTNLRVKIKACSVVHLIIQKVPVLRLSNAKNYAFIIGGSNNTKVQLRSAVYLTTIKTAFKKSLYCNKEQPFWYSWKNGYLKIGKGTVLFKNEVLASSVAPLNDYKYVFVGTGWGKIGCWTIDIGDQILTQKWRKSNRNKRLNGSSVISYTTKSNTGCMTKCAYATHLSCSCQQFSFNQYTNECLVVSSDKSAILVVDGVWNTWDLIT